MKKSMVFVSEILVVLILFSMGFLATYVVDSYANLKLLEKINSGYITDNAITFQLTEDTRISFKEISTLLQAGNYLFQKTGERLEDITIFSYADNLFFDISEGRQFNQVDLEQEHELRMIGNKRLDEDVSDCEKIAILGCPTPSLLDSTCVILPSATERQLLLRGTWIIDGPNKVEQSFTSLCNVIGSSKINRTQTERVGVYRISRTNRMSYWLLCLIIICCALTYIPTIMFWIECRNELCLLIDFLGVRRRAIGFHLLKLLIVPATSALAIGAIAATFVLRTYIKTNWKFACIVFLVGIVYVILSFILSFLVYRSEHAWNEVK